MSAPAPATKTRVDQSSPKSLLRTFFASNGDIDEATLRSVLHATNPSEQQLLESVVTIALANSRLASAETAKFGRATTAPSITPSFAGDSGSDLNALKESVQGDRATVMLGDDPESSIEFVRVNGKWKLPIASLVGSVDPATAQSVKNTTKAQLEIIEAVTADVKSGKLKDEEQVRQELLRRFTEKLAAATRSATQPASPATPRASRPARGT